MTDGNWNAGLLVALCAGIAMPALAQESGAGSVPQEHASSDNADKASMADSSTAGGLVIAKAESEKYGPYIVDASGRPLYAMADAEDEADADDAACDADCASKFEPVESSGRILADRVLPGLIGDAGEDGGKVTFRGHELYRHADHAGRGDDAPQNALGGRFFLVSVTGEVIKDGQKDLPAASGPVDPQVMAMGNDIFAASCSSCHGNNGQGAYGPALAEYQRLADAEAVVDQVILGGGDMPSFADALSDDQIAAVTTYIRNSWGNEFGPIPAQLVASER